MADDKRREASERLKTFGALSLDDVAVEAAFKGRAFLINCAADSHLRRLICDYYYGIHFLD